MPAISASAPGKIILFGEHAVVYGRPALAVPIQQVKARCIVTADPAGPPGLVRIQASEIGLDASLDELPDNHPLKAAVDSVTTVLNISHLPACTLRISSTIPVASGLGSGAAVSVAILRAVSAFVGHPLPDEQLSLLAYEIEKLHHGTPSGIDNTVIAFGKPVFFQRGKTGEDPRIELIQVAQPFTLVIADTGVPSPTALAVGDVRQHWLADKVAYERSFDAIGEITQKARKVIKTLPKPQNPSLQVLGTLMDQNHELLIKIGVSSQELECLVNVARQAGALGAKLSGAGCGGNMIALVLPGQAEYVTRALQAAGAKHTILATIGR